MGIDEKVSKSALSRVRLPSEEELEKKVNEILAKEGVEDIEAEYDKTLKNFEPGTIVKGHIVEVTPYDVVISIGYKSEGIVPLDQFDEGEAEVGKEVEVFIERVEDEYGMVALNKRRADRIRAWDNILTTKREGDVIRCKVLRKIKGGLLVDVGVPVFLPASQVGIRRAPDIAEYIGKEFDVKVIKIDRERMNIVVSRRKLEEEMREGTKQKLLAHLAEGQIVKGVVKNITDFGAFVDLGGIDGLLHITDMSWSRISHPSEIVAIGDEIEVVVLKIDKEKERISLGLKQKTPNPWAEIDQKYPVNSHHRGKVVNILPYGAFVRLEDGVEGLVHISEMSWTC
ncbi:MAG: S1 RNA-binding domain-containing protein, partial [Planctomycetota bacterium]|nr:S1 RNA-binding domain-containing protein [Planctomycetota bacterium]